MRISRITAPHGIEPHDVENTVSLAKAKDMITIIQKTLGESIAVIDSKVVNQIKREGAFVDIIKKLENSNEPLTAEEMEELNYEMTDKIISYIDFSVCQKTVCSHPDCVETVGDNQLVKPKSCHDHCFIKGVEDDNMGHEKLKKCEIFHYWKYCIGKFRLIRCF